MEVQKFNIEGLLLIKPTRFHDERGFFTERFRIDKMTELGLPPFVQENFSRSNYAVTRGLHYQVNPGQGKLVSCTRGHIFDVAVDIRKGSPTFGQHVAVELKGDEPMWFWVPAGFAHGFQVLSQEGADLWYKVDQYRNPEGERVLRWDDRELLIDWPIRKAILNPRDGESTNLIAELRS